MRVLAVDVGGTHVKLLATGEKTPREFSSGPTLTAEQMVGGVKTVAADWKYDAVSIGYPGPVLDGRPVVEPHNLGRGWVGFDYRAAFGCPVKLVNDAAMQALGSYKGGKMLFLGLGTGLGTTLIVEGIVEPMELGHLPYRDGTFEQYVGLHGFRKNGLVQWRRDVEDVVWSPRSSRRTSCSGAATSTSWRPCRPAAGPATTRPHFSGPFACGKQQMTRRATPKE
jgi:polyphosphate glucokinase